MNIRVAWDEWERGLFCGAWWHVIFFLSVVFYLIIHSGERQHHGKVVLAMGTGRAYTLHLHMCGRSCKGMRDERHAAQVKLCYSVRKPDPLYIRTYFSRTSGTCIQLSKVFSVAIAGDDIPGFLLLLHEEAIIHSLVELVENPFKVCCWKAT